ncbi:MAG TPA: DUF6666 family protein [Pirellulales bacterium]
MGIFSGRITAGLAAALVLLGSSARAQTYAGANSADTNSYYSQQESNNILTGSNDKQPAAAPAQPIGNCNWSDACSAYLGDWRDNTMVWAGADAYKSLGDFTQPPGPGAGFMNSAGIVGGFNTGFRLGESRIRGQVGASYGIYDLKGRDTVSAASSEQQTFITAGIYKRSDVSNGDRISWASVYDQFFGHQWGLFASEVYLSQFRGILGYAINECNEVGVWGTFHTNNDGSVTGQPTPIRAMNQANVYWRHNFEMGAQTFAYLGAVDSADIASWLVGLNAQAPLNDFTSLYTNITFAFPGSHTGPVGSNELEWNIGAGLAYYLGGKAISPNVSGQRGLPLLPVANNGSLLITN